MNNNKKKRQGNAAAESRACAHVVLPLSTVPAHTGPVPDGSGPRQGSQSSGRCLLASLPLRALASWVLSLEVLCSLGRWHPREAQMLRRWFAPALSTVLLCAAVFVLLSGEHAYEPITGTALETAGNAHEQRTKALPVPHALQTPLVLSECVLAGRRVGPMAESPSY